MDRIAVISDIHSNMPALTAVIKDIKRRRIKRIVCLGDLVGKGPQPAEVIDLIRSSCEVVVQGNWDAGINNPQRLEAGIWQKEKIGAERLDYLNGLPFHYDCELSGQYIRMFHASASSIYDRVQRGASKKEKRALFMNTARIEPLFSDRLPQVVLYGDIHKPYFQMVSTKQGDGLAVWNVGSVGLPYDGVPQACYAIVEGETGTIPAPLGVQLIRVPYDTDSAVTIAEEAGLPDLQRYKHEVLTGRQKD